MCYGIHYYVSLVIGTGKKRKDNSVRDHAQTEVSLFKFLSYYGAERLGAVASLSSLGMTGAPLLWATFVGFPTTTVGLRSSMGTRFALACVLFSPAAFCGSAR